MGLQARETKALRNSVRRSNGGEALELVPQDEGLLHDVAAFAGLSMFGASLREMTGKIQRLHGYRRLSSEL
ncbi:hypothetical protein [Streptomyces sp. NPDC086787]|uniref:hypothetical protein n=1 Tax=Streptomyces sp. NPDC086787 TaxID=3365759 RepID=UPI003801AC9C